MSSSKPSHHTTNGTGFRNPWKSALPPTWSELATNPFPLEWAKAYVAPNDDEDIQVDDLEFTKPDWGVGRGGDKSIKTNQLASELQTVQRQRGRGSVCDIGEHYARHS